MSKLTKNKISLSFKLQGRLGNQIWGLSEAHRIHRVANEKIEILVDETITTDMPQEWREFIESQKWLHMRKESCDARNEAFIAIQSNILAQINAGVRAFRGFVPSYCMLVESGLYQEGLFPFGNFTSTTQNDFISLGIRRGDYWQNPHLGVLPRRYYKTSLEKIDLLDESLPICVFGIDSKAAIYSNLPRKYWDRIKISEYSNQPMWDLFQLSKASYSIIANSTFSYLGAYFSRSNRIVIPNPFYLMDESWGTALLSSRIEQIEYLGNKKRRYFILRAVKKLSSLGRQIN